MRQTQLHFVTGKGGVGKSTYAATLVKKLSLEKAGPILLLEVQGSGQSLKFLEVDNYNAYQLQAIPNSHLAWGSRILPRPAFRQYFSLLLAMGGTDSTFATLTSGLREKLVDKVFENKVVSAFIDVCPGLEPAALLGKIHWESTEGKTPETELPWKHIVVDAPATGHSLMLFRSTQALVNVFGSGVVFKQASAIMNLMKDSRHTDFHIVTTPEELPLQESIELDENLQKLGLPKAKFTINRIRPALTSVPKSDLANFEDSTWKREVEIEIDRAREEDERIQNFLNHVGTERVINRLPEKSDPIQSLNEFAQSIQLQQGASI